MNKSEILTQLNDVFVEVLDDEAVKINIKTSMDSLEDWDSLTHVQLILSIEKKFNVHFTSTAIQECKSIEKIINYIIA
jgi:acyl carrier protein